jgi:hypothetical protein
MFGCVSHVSASLFDLGNTITPHTPLAPQRCNQHEWFLPAATASLRLPVYSQPACVLFVSMSFFTPQHLQLFLQLLRDETSNVAHATRCWAMFCGFVVLARVAGSTFAFF